MNPIVKHSSVEGEEGEKVFPPPSWFEACAVQRYQDDDTGKILWRGWKVTLQAVLVRFLFHQVLRDSQLWTLYVSLFLFMVTQTQRRRLCRTVWFSILLFNVKSIGGFDWKVHCQWLVFQFLFSRWKRKETFPSDSFFSSFVCEILRVTRWLTEWEAFIGRHQDFHTQLFAAA